VCWTFVGPLFGWVSGQVSCSILYKLFFGLGLLDSGSVWLAFAWFGWWIFQLSFVPLMWICFPGLECRVATLLNPFTGSLLWRLVCTAPYLPPDTGLLQFLSTQTFVITFVVKGAGYQVVKGIRAGMWSSTLSTKAHTTKKTSHIGI